MLYPDNDVSPLIVTNVYAPGPLIKADTDAFPIGAGLSGSRAPDVNYFSNITPPSGQLKTLF
jgi:hypothetical protein